MNHSLGMKVVMCELPSCHLRSLHRFWLVGVETGGISVAHNGEFFSDISKEKFHDILVAILVPKVEKTVRGTGRIRKNKVEEKKNGK